MIDNNNNHPNERPGRSDNEILYGTIDNPFARARTNDSWQDAPYRGDLHAGVTRRSADLPVSQANFDGTWLDGRLGWRTRARLFAIYLISAIGLFIVVATALNFIAKF